MEDECYVVYACFEVYKDLCNRYIYMCVYLFIYLFIYNII